MILIVGLLATLLFPALQRSKARAKDVICLSQLKQIGVAAIAFAGENEDRLPAATMPNTNRFLSPLQPVLRDTGDGKIYVCPRDIERKPSLNRTALNRTNTSYFVSYSARTDLQSILAGDRNVTWDGALVTGANKFQRTYRFGWWRNMHRWKGNLLLSDGSVHLTTPQQLAEQVGREPEPTFDWYIPNGDVVFTPE